MSLKSWKEEFYPVDAEDVSEEDALEHSLRKWIGVKPENLKKHNVFKRYGLRHITDPNDKYDYMNIDSESCALCYWHFYNSRDNVDVDAPDQCETCPLYKQRGGLACDESTHSDSSDPFFNDSPYSDFTERNNPQPMIDLIQGAIDAKRD